MDSIAKFNEALKAAKTRMDAMCQALKFAPADESIEDRITMLDAAIVTRRQLLAATRRCGFDT
jgi:hypothetical protein